MTEASCRPCGFQALLVQIWRDHRLYSRFLFAHVSEVCEAVSVKFRWTQMQVKGLFVSFLHSRELALSLILLLHWTTAVCCACIKPWIKSDISFYLFQRQCLSLLVRLAGTDRARYLKQMEESVAPGDPADKREEMELAMHQVWGHSEAAAYFLGVLNLFPYTFLICLTVSLFGQICANIMEYCQTLLLQSSAEAQFTVCLFSPSASEPTGQLSFISYTQCARLLLRSTNKPMCIAPQT